MARPRLLMLDEPSLGLAPLMVAELFACIRRIHAEQVTILLVEQNVHQALDIADRAYVLETAARYVLVRPQSCWSMTPSRQPTWGCRARGLLRQERPGTGPQHAPERPGRVDQPVRALA